MREYVCLRPLRGWQWAQALGSGFLERLDPEAIHSRATISKVQVHTTSYDLLCKSPWLIMIDVNSLTSWQIIFADPLLR